MKLWYQSMTREGGAWGNYPKALRQVLDKVKAPGTEIEVHGITKTGGAGDQYRYLEFLETGEVLENVHIAMQRGFDAFLIGNICDPGLREAREFASIPVLGLCESSLHLANMMGTSFSLVTINAKFTPRIIENVERYGLKSRLAAVNRMQVERLLDLSLAFEDPAVCARLAAEFDKAAKANADAGTEVVIAAGGVVMALLAHADIHEAGGGLPILNGITALVKTGEMAVGVSRVMGGRFASRVRTYAPPPADQIEELRKFYNVGIYPGVGRP
ncbi:MAG: aspartate/glutamate racemase family protein [Hyphomicrobiaceae bacterium]